MQFTVESPKSDKEPSKSEDSSSSSVHNIWDDNASVSVESDCDEEKRGQKVSKKSSKKLVKAENASKGPNLNSRVQTKVVEVSIVGQPFNHQLVLNEI